nr:bifunctional hydroxymethylpyrimidine kinase/phosphomethylpyrimidine kinase [Pontibacter sp. SGAir0037]
MLQYPTVLSIAGSDSGGGAGIQADLKTFSALGCFGTSAITAITAQNTCGVSAVHAVPAAIVQAQIAAVLDDMQPTAIKIGMVPGAGLVETIASQLQQYNLPLIIDPVLVASSGHHLTNDNTVSILKNRLFPLAELITPNLDEAELITGTSILSLEAMKKGARLLLETGCRAVLLKGGHLKSHRLYDVYLHQNGHEEVFESEAILSGNTHGTGCTLSSAIAAYIALGNELPLAVRKAREYVYQAIDQGKDVKTGQGNGPLNHFFAPLPMHKR